MSLVDDAIAGARLAAVDEAAAHAALEEAAAAVAREDT